MSFYGGVDLKWNDRLIAYLEKHAKHKEGNTIQTLVIPNLPEGLVEFVVDKERVKLLAHVHPQNAEERTNKAPMFRRAVDWIEKKFPKVIIEGAHWIDTAGSAQYIYKNKKLLLTKCGETTPQNSVIDGINPGKWAKTQYGGYVSESEYPASSKIVSWLTLDRNGKILKEKKAMFETVKSAPKKVTVPLAAILIFAVAAVLLVITFFAQQIRRLISGLFKRKVK